MSDLVPVWEEGSRLLATDPVFGPVVRSVGPVRMPRLTESPFATLVRSIVYQQLAGAAVATIHERLKKVLGDVVTPERLLAAPEGRLSSAGLSRSKLRAVTDLADKVSSGSLGLDDLGELSDEDVERRLVQVWGIGPWTARMFLIFHLRRPDVWPVGDLGVRTGWSKLHGLERVVEPTTLKSRGESYRPWRSAVAWYCWRAVERQ